ncbi:MAG: hypothetical protein ACR2HR_15850 [Euzebya sp.]
MPSSVGEVLRIVVIVGVLALLLRAGRAAWGRRRLAFRIWRSIRPRHVVGSLALIVVVLTVALSLLTFVPVTGVGLGQLLGLDGNAVFAPIDNALEAPIQAADEAQQTGTEAAGVPWTDIVGVTGFLAGLILLFPYLAHGEEEAFRAGWEDFDHLRQALSALRFGLIHMIMLIPLAAALAVGVAGYVYGRIYLRAYRRAAVPVATIPERRLWVATDEQGLSRLVMGPPSPVLTVDRTEARRQAVFSAAVWHTTFNTTVAVVVLVGYLLSL